MTPRTVVWFSCGAASAVAAMLTLRQRPDAVLAYCDTGAEDFDSVLPHGDTITIVEASKPE